MEQTKTRKEYEEMVELPEGVSVSYENKQLIVTGPKGEVKKHFDFPGVDITPSDGSVKLFSSNYGKRVKKLFATARTVIKNAAHGVVEPYSYELKVCSSHFPMNVKLSGNTLVIKNLFGEAHPREIIIKDGAEVKLEDTVITVESVDKELAGQVAADIEQGTQVKNRDHRIFQDGIYITKKAK